MTELAYQDAPGASYYFATCGDSLQAFAAAVTSLQAAGCNVIVDDVSFPTEESFYQTGTVLDQAIEAAVAAGTNYFTAAGNSGDDYVRQGFSPINVSIPAISSAAVTANNFGGSSPYQDISISEHAEVTIELQWAQPFASIGQGGGGAQNSLAFYLLNSQGSIVASSNQVVLGDDPVQALSFDNFTGSTQFRLVVVENGGVTPTGQSFTISVLDSALATLQGADVGGGSGDVMGHALLSGVNAVGAVTYSSTPAFGVSPAVPAYYTATGPGTILFNSQGEALATPVTADAPAFLGGRGVLDHRGRLRTLRRHIGRRAQCRRGGRADAAGQRRADDPRGDGPAGAVGHPRLDDHGRFRCRPDPGPRGGGTFGLGRRQPLVGGRGRATGPRLGTGRPAPCRPPPAR